MWGGVPDRWAARGGRPVEPERAEPTDGRHAFDQDAALTPIFTALRRGGRRRLRPAAPPLRVVRDPVDDYHHSDPPTAPIPVVPALYAVDPYPSGGYAPSSVDPYPTGGYPPPAAVDPYAGAGYRYPAQPPTVPRSVAPPPSHNETTTVWYLSDDPAVYEPVPYESVAYGPGSYQPGSYQPGPSGPGSSESGPYGPGSYGPGGHRPVTDTGRHHRRLAPAGW